MYELTTKALLNIQQMNSASSVSNVKSSSKLCESAFYYQKLSQECFLACMYHGVTMKHFDMTRETESESRLMSETIQFFLKKEYS